MLIDCTSSTTMGAISISAPRPRSPSRSLPCRPSEPRPEAIYSAEAGIAAVEVPYQATSSYRSSLSMQRLRVISAVCSLSSTPETPRVEFAMGEPYTRVPHP